MINKTKEKRKMALNRIMSDRNRTQIVAYLASHGPKDHASLRNKFGLSDRHMTGAIGALLECGYVSRDQICSGGLMFFGFPVTKPKKQINYTLTAEGKVVFGAYLRRLKATLHESGAL